MHPLGLPELRILIGRHLSKNDILACNLVCKAWHIDFQPLLYCSITLDDPTLRIIPKKVLHQHAHLIRHLVLAEPMRLTVNSFNPSKVHCSSLQTPPQSLQHILPSIEPSLDSHSTATKQYSQCYSREASICQNLVSLDINPSLLFRRRVHEQVPKHKFLIVGTDQYDDLQDDFWCLQSTDACIRLIQQNPNLQLLTESWEEMSSFHRIRFTKQLCQLQHQGLRMLHLCKWEVLPSEIQCLIKNLPSLFLLRFSKLTLKNGTGVAVGLRSSAPMSAEETAMLPCLETPSISAIPLLDLQHLKVLVMTHATFQMNDLRIEAPSLIVLSVSFSQVQPNVWLSSPNIVWNTPSLMQLIHNRTERTIGTASLLSSPHSLRAVSFADYELPSQLTTDMVKMQGQHLQSIRLACFTGITPTDLRLILTSCPNLINFYAPEIRVWAGDLIPISTGRRAMNKDPSFLSSCNLHGSQRTMSKGVNMGYKSESNDNSENSTHKMEVEGSQQHYQKMAWSKNRVSSPCSLHSTYSHLVTDLDDNNRKDWVCHNLEKLSIYVSLESIMEDGETVSNIGHIHSHGYGNQTEPPYLSSLNKETQEQLFNRHYPQSFQKDRQHRQAWRHFQHRFDIKDQRDHQLRNETVNGLVRVAFLSQLSKLTRLKYLDLSGEHVKKANHGQIGLPWTIAGGIEQLASLRKLEHIAVTGWVDQMGPVEIEWMKQSWPKLTHISLLEANALEMSRFQTLLNKMWPDIIVQDKARNKGSCPPLYLC